MIFSKCLIQVHQKYLFAPEDYVYNTDTLWILSIVVIVISLGKISFLLF